MAQPSRRQKGRKTATKKSTLPKQLQIRYTKSAASRVVHADGAYGGVTPHLDIYMALYSQHNTTPESSELELDHSTKTAREEIQVPPNPWVREIETEVIMSRNTARALRDWLTGRLEIADNMEADPSISFTTQTAATGDRYADTS